MFFLVGKHGRNKTRQIENQANKLTVYRWRDMYYVAISVILYTLSSDLEKAKKIAMELNSAGNYSRAL